MRQARIILMMSVLCWTTSYLFGQDIPKPMNPPRLVNDFANLIPPAMETELETKLLALEKSATIEVAVVTLSSNAGHDLEGLANALFNDEHWRIGKKELDNGLLFLISMDKADRGVRLETGYGTEEILPDLICGRIIKETILPEMSRGHYGKGIEAGVNRIISELGKAETRMHGTPEAYGKAQKEEIAHVREVKSEQESSDNTQSVLLVLASLIFLSLFGYFIYALHMRQKKLAARRKRISDMKSAYETACCIPEKDTEWPTWALEKFEHCSNAHEVHRRQAKMLIYHLPEKNKDIIKLDDVPFELAEKQVGEVEKMRTAMLQVVSLVEIYAKGAANMQKAAADQHQRTEKYVSDMANRHATGEYVTLLKEKATELGKLSIVTKDDYRSVYLSSQAILDQCKSIEEELRNEERLRLEIGDSMSKVGYGYEQAEISLKGLKPKAEALWSSYSGKCLEGLLTYAVLAKLFEDGTSDQAQAHDLLRSNTRLKYNGADMLLREAGKKLASLSEGIATIESRKADIGAKKRGYAEALKSARALYETAKLKVANSDVKRSTKELVEKAAVSLAEVDTLTDSNRRPDWIGAFEALEKSNELSQKAIDKARSEISAAHAARVEAARPKYRPTNIGGGSIRIGGGNRSGGFGGFGGGRSGGGGASGRF